MDELELPHQALKSLVEVVNEHYQTDVKCAQAVKMYNTGRPHWALNFKTPQVHETVA
jgi:hypothetical protein